MFNEADSALLYKLITAFEIELVTFQKGTKIVDVEILIKFVKKAS